MTVAVLAGLIVLAVCVGVIADGPKPLHRTRAYRIDPGVRRAEGRR
ncbi:MAG: hypothetical protein ABI862_18440 [Ilumatobacteraceae bacterium]